LVYDKNNNIQTPGLRVKLEFYLDQYHNFSGQNEFGMNKVPVSADLRVAIEGNEKSRSDEMIAGSRISAYITRNGWNNLPTTPNNQPSRKINYYFYLQMDYYQ
jgi:hypothetical protein